jgi:hypothetical protein
MKYFLMVLVASVFIGTEILAIPTPFAQLTIYRVFALSIPLLIGYFMVQKNPRLEIKKNSYATFSVAVFIFWWLWSIVSFLWIKDLRLWLQAVFLLTLGISSILGLYFWVQDFKQWKKLLQIAWFMMSLLVGLGYYEIITNHYIFADLGKLDRYSTFVSDPMTRMPITHFENQNDFATMLLAYLSVSLILYYVTPNAVKKISYLISVFLGSYLIYRSGSRMILLCLILYMFCLVALQFKWDLKRKYYGIALALFIILGILALAYVPPVQDMVDTLIYTGGSDIVTGDTGRVNLVRNGIIFLAATFGLGVGAGNIEAWMANYRFLPTQNIINMHHWWAEILVAYGVIVFILYTLAYILLIYRLFQIRNYQTKRLKNVSNQLIAFLIVYSLASITSASNMLIEWHWVFFGLIIAYIKIYETNLSLVSDKLSKLRGNYEFNYNLK